MAAYACGPTAAPPSCAACTAAAAAVRAFSGGAPFSGSATMWLSTLRLEPADMHAPTRARPLPAALPPPALLPSPSAAPGCNKPPPPRSGPTVSRAATAETSTSPSRPLGCWYAAAAAPRARCCCCATAAAAAASFMPTPRAG
eukprot:173177-Chlamydomonas_euryale.AAC.2